MEQTNFRVRRNDIVKVIKGRDRGKVGKVRKVLPRSGRVIIEKVNVVKKHVKPSNANPQGGILEKELPVPMANVMVMCDKCNSPVRIGRMVTEGGEKFRFCKSCGETIEAKKK